MNGCRNIRRFVVPALLSLGAVAAAHAQEGLMTMHQVTLAAAQQMANAAVMSCSQKGYKVTAVVVDRQGSPIVSLRADGASEFTNTVARRKALTAAAFGAPTSALAQRLGNNSGFNVHDIMPQALLLAGAVPISADNETIGAVGVSGAPGGDIDESCAQAGLMSAMDQLH